MTSEPATTDQAMLRDVARDVLDRYCAPADVRRHTASGAGFDQSLWALAAELGWFAIEAPASIGGTEGSFAETAVVLEELGRHTTPGPYLSHLVATGCLTSAGGACLDTWGERLVNGTAIGCVVPLPPGRRPEVCAERRGHGLVLSGNVAHALDVAYADLVLLPVVLEAATAVVAFEPRRDGVEVIDRVAVDKTRRVGSLRCDGAHVPATVLECGQAAERLLLGAWGRGATAVALDALGCAQEVLHRTVEYTSQRHQFGRPIATFQAVKHGCADMLVAVETGRAAVRLAVRDVGTAPMFPRSVAVAKAHATDGANYVVGRGLQLHGGIGFTWEFDLHLWVKRVKLDTVLFGSSADHRASSARLLFRQPR